MLSLKRSESNFLQVFRNNKIGKKIGENCQCEVKPTLDSGINVAPEITVILKIFTPRF